MAEIMTRSVGRVVAKRTLSVMVLILGVVLGTAGLAAGEQGRISKLTGTVEVGRGNPPAFAKARAGDVVNPGDMIRTGHGGRAELRLAAGTVRLYENSLLRIPAKPNLGHQLELEQGRSIFDVIKASVRDRFEVRTPEVVVSVKGTRFEVDLAGELAEVAVFRGVVGVRAPDAHRDLETLVREGFAAIGASDVPFELDLSPRVDPWNSWAQLSDGQDTAMNRGRTERQAQSRAAAQSAARRSSDKQLVEIATKRNPELARRIEALRKERLAATQTEPDERSEKATQDVPAALADFAEDTKRGQFEDGRGTMTFRSGDSKPSQLALDVDASDIIDKIEASQEDFRQIAILSDASSDTADIQTPKDPSGAMIDSSWDPTPEVSLLEVASIQNELSYTELINIWYNAVDSLQNTQPSIFTKTDPSAYQAALEQKFIDGGISDSAAQSIARYIVSKIQ